MNEAAQTLFDYTDFTSFSKLHTDVKTNNCKIMHAAWTRVDDVTWVFTIQADRFLRNMVRAIVGTLLEVGRGKLSVEVSTRHRTEGPLPCRNFCSRKCIVSGGCSLSGNYFSRIKEGCTTKT